MAIAYILYSKNLDRHYMGHTDLSMQERLEKHLGEHSGFTSKTKDWTPVWIKEFGTKAEAYQCERQLKKMKSRRAIEIIIKKA